MTVLVCPKRNVVLLRFLHSFKADHLVSRFQSSPQRYAQTSAARKTQTQYFFLMNQEEEWRNCLEFVVIVSQLAEF